MDYLCSLLVWFSWFVDSTTWKHCITMAGKAPAGLPIFLRKMDSEWTSSTVYSISAAAEYSASGKDLTHTKIYGTDYNPSLIRWCEDNLPFVRVSVNDLNSRTDYPDNSFDIVYTISVFTHLLRAMQSSCLDELIRVTKPGGYIIITVHGLSRTSVEPITPGTISKSWLTACSLKLIIRRKVLLMRIRMYTCSGLLSQIRR